MFSRSKRFPDDKSACAPPPGHYDPKYNSRLPGPVTFTKSPREKSIKNVGPSVGQYDPKYPDYSLRCSMMKTPGLRTTQSSTSSLFIRTKSSAANAQITTTDKRKSQSTSNLQVVNKIDLNNSEEDLTKCEEYHQRIMEHEKTLEDYRNENQRLLDIEKENIEKIGLLAAALNDITCDRNSLLKQVEELKSGKIFQCVDLQRLKDENKELIEKFTIEEKELRHDKERYAEQMAEIQRNLQNYVERNEQLNNTNALNLAENEAILIEVTDLKKSRNSLENRLVKLEEEVRDHIGNNEQLKDDYQRISNRLQAKSDKLLQAESAQATFEKQIAQFKDKIINGDNDYRLLKQEYDTMSEKLYTKDNELLQVKENYLSTAKHASNLEKKIAEYEKINATMSKEKEDLAELVRIKEIEIQKSVNNDNLVRELEKKVNDHLHGNQRLMDENRELKDVIVENDSQLIQFYNTINSMKAQLKELHNIHAYAKVMNSELIRVKTLLKSAVEESASYKSQYDDLTSKIKPFKEQLEMYYAERNTLISMENESELKVKELFDQYANLLTHQNNKQKIRHVVKLKEENLKCRAEVAALRKELARSKAVAASYKNKMDHLQGKRRFDPKLAFRHDKENDDPCEN